MPDISMCLNQTCQKRVMCYRYRAIPFKIQTYSQFKPINGKCTHFMPIISGDQLRSLSQIEKV